MLNLNLTEKDLEKITSYLETKANLTKKSINIALDDAEQALEIMYDNITTKDDYEELFGEGGLLASDNELKERIDTRLKEQNRHLLREEHEKYITRFIKDGYGNLCLRGLDGTNDKPLTSEGLQEVFAALKQRDQFKNITILIVPSQRLKSLTDLPPNLEYLQCLNNPELSHIDYPELLISLDTRGTNISEIPNLPNLRYIRITRTPIKTIPEGCPIQIINASQDTPCPEDRIMTTTNNERKEQFFFEKCDQIDMNRFLEDALKNLSKDGEIKDILPTVMKAFFEFRKGKLPKAHLSPIEFHNSFCEIEAEFRGQEELLNKISQEYKTTIEEVEGAIEQIYSQLEGDLDKIFSLQFSTISSIYNHKDDGMTREQRINRNLGGETPEKQAILKQIHQKKYIQDLLDKYYQESTEQ